jgi:ATP-binding cassette subfamily B protein
MVWLVIFFGRKMTSTYRSLFGEVGNFNARIEDNVGGIRVVQSFANERYEEKLFAVDNQNYRTTKLLATVVGGGYFSTR